MKTRRAKYKSLSPPQQHGSGDSAAEEITSNSGAVEADSTSPERDIIETIREEFNGEEHATAGVMGIVGDSFNGDDVAGGDDGGENHDGYRSSLAQSLQLQCYLFGFRQRR